MKGEEQELMWALQGLAQTAEIQSSLYPDFVCKGDEVAVPILLMKVLFFQRKQRNQNVETAEHLDAGNASKPHA